MCVCAGVHLCCSQASFPILPDFGAMEYVRFLDGLERMRVPPGEEWTQEFFRSSADKIVRTAERVRHRAHNAQHTHNAQQSAG